MWARRNVGYPKRRERNDFILPKGLLCDAFARSRFTASFASRRVPDLGYSTSVEIVHVLWFCPLNRPEVASEMTEIWQNQRPDGWILKADL